MSANGNVFRGIILLMQTSLRRAFLDRFPLEKLNVAFLRLVSWVIAWQPRCFGWTLVQVPGSPSRVQDDGAHTSEKFKWDLLIYPPLKLTNLI